MNILRLSLPIALLLLAPILSAAAEWKVAPGGELPRPLVERLERDVLKGDGWPDALLLHFSDCRSDLCIDALRELEDFVMRPLEARGLALAVVVPGADQETLSRLRGQYADAPLVILSDPSGGLLRGLVAEPVVPLTLFLGPGGTVVYRHAGYTPGREAEFRHVAELLLAGDPLPPHLGRPGGTGMDSRFPPSPSRGAELVGKPAPELHVEGWINDPPEREGKHTLVEFWATWCGPCIATMNLAEALHGEVEDRLVTLAISSEPRGTIAPAVEQLGWKQPIGYDTKGRTQQAVRFFAIPSGYLVDPEGIVIWQGHPAELWVDDAARLRELLGGE